MPQFPAQLSSRLRWGFALTMPWFLVLFSYLLVGPAYWHSLRTFAGATLLNLVLLSTTFLAQNWVSERISQRLPRFEQTLWRVGLTLLAHVTLSGVFLAMVAALYIHFRLFGSTVSYPALLKVYTLNLIALVLVIGLYESFHALSQWRQQQMDRETLKRENLSGQLQGLKSQVSPHFLFNSFNSLSSLIADEPAKAEQFVDEMARVYRYLLQSHGPAPGQPDNGAERHDELTTLDCELAFIDSYYHLLKTRHGPGLHLSVNVEPSLRQHRLPPLTLQLLVENAVKHNVILPHRPLLIDIATTAQGRLRVRNNLQKKAARAGGFESTGIGLANIQARYQLLTPAEQPVIEADSSYFTVTLPLLATTPPNL
ncbi:sensor histidine kinase [Hymenobacter properus]|uniref:Histidine kinase n=1 Tax=Hymenobacter properus TaxID=2791026 RepID=A0A931BDP6_9BACT|nr:histidine kinase [Hymenobacter properus]MBF9141924.1 histidine kinase [Hymenobacter properus]MBR7720732.1 histidine kinase [Microvirga sp. SRT04]